MVFRNSIAVCSFVSGAIVVVLALAQIPMILLEQWPSSKFLWFVHFEFITNLDLVFKLFGQYFPETGFVEYLVFLGLFFAIALCGWYFRVRLFQGLAFHYALLVAALIAIDSYSNLSRAHSEPPLGAALVFVVALAAGVLLANGCLRVHLRYIAVFRA